MSSSDIKTTRGVSGIVESEENEHELTQWNTSAVDTEPEKFRSRLRIIAVLAGLNVSQEYTLDLSFHSDQNV